MIQELIDALAGYGWINDFIREELEDIIYDIHLHSSHVIYILNYFIKLPSIPVFWCVAYVRHDICILIKYCDDDDDDDGGGGDDDGGGGGVGGGSRGDGGGGDDDGGGDGGCGGGSGDGGNGGGGGGGAAAADDDNILYTNGN